MRINADVNFIQLLNFNYHTVIIKIW